MSPKVTHEPPSTVGGGIVSAVALAARLLPEIVINEPGRKVAVPSAEFTMPRAPVAIVGRVSVPVGARLITLRPLKVIMYAVVPAESTAIWRGVVLNRVVPNTLTTGFSGTTPASWTSPVWMLTISSVVRESSRVTVVMFWRTGVVSQRKRWLSSGAALAMLRLPVLMTVMVGGWPGPPPPVMPVAPGEADPPRVVSDGFTIKPSTRKYEDAGPAP